MCFMTFVKMFYGLFATEKDLKAINEGRKKGDNTGVTSKDIH